MRHRLARLLLLCSVAGAVPPGSAGDLETDWIESTIEVNGRTVQEIRMGGAPGGDEIVVVVLTNGPAGGTSLAAKSLALEELFFGDPGAFEALGDGQFFALGGGCHLGGADVFVYIDSFKPKVLQVRDGVFDFRTPTVAAGDQYVGAECSVSADGGRIHYFFANRTQSRLEFFVEPLNGTISNENAGIASLGDVFAGFSRVAVDSGSGNDLNVFYQRNDGVMREVVIDGISKQLLQSCGVYTQVPPPGMFKGPKEKHKVRVPLRSGVHRDGTVGDFDGDDDVEVSLVNSRGDCAQTVTPLGPAGKAPPYGWSGYAAISDPGARWTLVGNAAAFGVLDNLSGAITPFTPPPFLPGGPITGLAVRDNDTRHAGGLLGAASLIDVAQVTFAYSADAFDHLSSDYVFAASFERPGPGSVGVRER
jgi:hypothetical protein